jgi:aspartokinase/homoserine dehydrogenase 1
MKVYKFGSAALKDSSDIFSMIEAIKRESPDIIVVSSLGNTSETLRETAMIAEQKQDFGKELEKIRLFHEKIARESLVELLLEKTLSGFESLFAELKDLLHGVQLLKDLSTRTLDQILSFGERLSALLFSAMLEAQGVDVAVYDSRDFIRTDAHFGQARCLEDESQKLIASAFKQRTARTSLVTGFLGATKEGYTTTLGLGGREYVACMIGASLGASEVHIWTDAAGMLTADSRLVPDAFPIEEISFEEALEMTHFGARVLSPASIHPVMTAGIPVRIRDCRNPSSKGTRIVKRARPSDYPVRGLASIPSVSLLSIHGLGLPGVTGIAARMFGALAAAKINVILITQASSELSICCAINPMDSDAGVKALAEEFSMEIDAGLIAPPEINGEMSVIAVVGEQMRQRTGIAGRVFTALGRNGVNVVAIAQGSSELNISIVTYAKDRAKALNVIHDAFFLAGIRTVNLFLSGTGLIGKTLLAQIETQGKKLLEQHSTRIKIAGIINSRFMVIDPKGIPVGEWRSRLEEGESSNMAAFVDLMKALNLPSACFCDCTASDVPPKFYEGIFEASISIVTPNKRANAGPADRYRRLVAKAREKDVIYGYETTVGAGLPVIGTLHDLVACGDSISRIEAVLSGTISYIFNNLRRGMSFSSLVLDAKSRGYTEPDPRDDLGAVDIARKTLILAREAGFAIDYENISIQALIPEKLAAAPSVEEFLALLPEADIAMEEKVAAATSRGKVLRYVATITPESAALKLQEYGPESPFFNLSGTDNLVMFSTSRYSANPLVVRGPGAGAEVTAGGVFADILKTAQSYL